MDTTELEAPAAALLRKKEGLHTADSHHLENCIINIVANFKEEL